MERKGAAAGQKNQLSPDLRRPNLRLWYFGTRVQRAVMDRLITKDGGSGSSGLEESVMEVRVLYRGSFTGQTLMS